MLLGSAEHSLLDSKDFYRPVVTPYELHLALTDGAEWTGDYILDYARMLPRLQADEAAGEAGEGDSAAGVVGGDDDVGGEGSLLEGEEVESAPPQFSMLSGRLIGKRAPLGMQHQQPSIGGGTASAAAADGGAADGGAGSGSGGTLAAASAGGVLARQGDYAIARTGAEVLARREYRGLEVRLGEHAPALVVEGRAGIASGFDGEGRVGGDSYGEAAAAVEAAAAAAAAAVETTAGRTEAAAVTTTAACVDAK